MTKKHIIGIALVVCISITFTVYAICPIRVCVGINVHYGENTITYTEILYVIESNKTIIKEFSEPYDKSCSFGTDQSVSAMGEFWLPRYQTWL